MDKVFTPEVLSAIFGVIFGFLIGITPDLIRKIQYAKKNNTDSTKL
jgi:hypothetical protein